MTVETPKPKLLLRPIITGANGAINQSEFLVITCNSLKAREKSRVHNAIGFGFASHWLQNWSESIKPITKRSNRNHVITFDSHLKTALKWQFSVCFVPVRLLRSNMAVFVPCDCKLQRAYCWHYRDNQPRFQDIAFLWE